MATVVIDYGSGNLHSVAKALERAARTGGRGGPVTVTSDPDTVRHAERVVLPGVGAFAACRDGLYAVQGMVEALTEAVRERARPFLGICVGMQLMATEGREHGSHAGLDWVNGVVESLPTGHGLRIPHMGWNTVGIDAPQHAVLSSIARGTHYYFVHSFHLRVDSDAEALASTDYGMRFASVVGRENMMGTQFHPEKSQEAGQTLLRNFLAWAP